MFRSVRIFATFIVAITVLQTVWTPPASAEIPNSDSPDAYTEKRFRQDLLAHNIRTMSEAYREVGNRDPKWDDLMIEYLDAQAVVFTNGGASGKTKVPVTTSRARILELTTMARDLGCTDPLVNYVYLVNSKSKDERYLKFARKIYNELLESEYPINRKIAAANRLINILDDRDLEEEAQEVVQVWTDLFCRVVSDPNTSLRDQYFLFRNYMKPANDKWLARWERMCRRIDVEDPPNPWLVGAMCGSYHIKIAWKFRGDDWASAVTDEGWEGFHKHLRTARKHYVSAWEFAPQFPVVPDQLIAVSMGLRNGEERLWFERAVQAQFDYYPAYTSYLWSIRPRWGGSLNQMHAFGVECLETGRFDTRVPVLFYKALNDIEEDSGYDYWKRPGVYEQFLTYFDGRKTVFEENSPPQWWDSMKAAVAWRIDRYDEAVAWMTPLGDELRLKTFTYFDGDTVLAPSECHARINVPEAVFDEARQFWMDDKYRGASKVFEMAIAGMEPGDPARPYLRHLSVWAQRLHQEKRGTWIDLLGQPDTVGWITRRGDWSADEQGRLTGVSDKDGFMLESRFHLGYRIEVKGSITFTDDVVLEETIGGILLAFRKSNGKYYHRGVLLDPNTGEAESSMDFGWRQRYPADADKTNRFHIQMWDETLRLTVNDRVVFEGLTMQEDLPRKVYPLAIGGWTSQAGITIRFDELKAKRLTLQPAWVPDPAQPDGLSRAYDGALPTTDRVAISAGMRYKTLQVPGG